VARSDVRLWVGTALSLRWVVLAMSPHDRLPELFGLLQQERGWIEFVLGTPVVLWAAGRSCASSGFRWCIARSHVHADRVGGGLRLPVQPRCLVFSRPVPARVPRARRRGWNLFRGGGRDRDPGNLGDFLQLRAMGQTARPSKNCCKSAHRAWRLGDDGSEEQVPLESIAVGHRLRVSRREKCRWTVTVLEGAEPGG